MVSTTVPRHALKDLVRSVPDFPKKGILFRDVTTLLLHPQGFTSALEYLVEDVRDLRADAVMGIEARGFIFGAALAGRLGTGFIPARKKGKLPAATRSVEYDLEYGTDTIQVHEDAVRPGMRILLHDDLLATGGTMAAAVRLVQQAGGIISGISFLIELSVLKGRDRLKPHPVRTVIAYDGET